MFGDEYDIGAARDSAVSGDPTGVSPHHFDDHHAVMRLGCGVQAVNGLHHGVDGCVEAEGEVCADEVVVNRLRYADERETVFVPNVARCAQSPLAADDDEGVECMALPSLAYEARVVCAVVRISAGGSEDGS